MPISNRRLGVHTSIAGGIHLSLERAKTLGCNTIQIFSHNPRQWFVSEIPEHATAKFRELRKAYDINPVYIHTSYLINLAASNNDILDKSVRLLIQELDIADKLGVEYVVLHTGSASQDTEDNARKRATEALKNVAQEKAWKTKLLLENTAGERGDISSHIKDLAEILHETGEPLIGGICIDTCHAHAAGYDLSDREGLQKLVCEIETLIGFNKLKLIHLNDSKKGYNSRVDRHEHIGHGSIGGEGLKRFANHPALKNIPLILETPKKSDEDDIKNLKTVNSFFRSKPLFDSA